MLCSDNVVLLPESIFASVRKLHFIDLVWDFKRSGLTNVCDIDRDIFTLFLGNCSCYLEYEFFGDLKVCLWNVWFFIVYHCFWSLTHPYVEDKHFWVCLGRRFSLRTLSKISQILRPFQKLLLALLWLLSGHKFAVCLITEDLLWNLKVDHRFKDWAVFIRVTIIDSNRVVNLVGWVVNLVMLRLIVLRFSLTKLRMQSIC